MFKSTMKSTMKSAKDAFGIKSGVQIFPVNDTDRQIADIEKHMESERVAAQQFINELYKAQLNHHLAFKAFKKLRNNKPIKKEVYEEAKLKMNDAASQFSELLENFHHTVEKTKELFNEKTNLIAKRIAEAATGHGGTRKRRKYKNNKKHKKKTLKH